MMTMLTIMNLTAEEENVLSTASDAVNGTAAGDIIKNSLNGLSTAEHQSEVHYFLAGAIGASILTAVVLLVLLILRSDHHPQKEILMFSMELPWNKSLSPTLPCSLTLASSRNLALWFSKSWAILSFLI